MPEPFLSALLEHNAWANRLVIQACLGLSDAQLDAPPPIAAFGSIRQTLLHLVTSQRGYLALLTLPPEARPTAALSLAELGQSEQASSAGLLALAGRGIAAGVWLTTTDGYRVRPAVVLVQVINHATEHREQIKAMLSALGQTLPDVDGWEWGFATDTLAPLAT